MSLLERAIVDAHDYYGVYDAMRAQGKSLGRITPIPVALHYNETPDQFEAEFRCRIHLYNDLIIQRSQQINFVRQRVKKVTGGNVPPLTPY